MVQIRKGFTKLDTQPAEVKAVVMDLWNRGYALTSISNLLLRDHGLNISNRSISNFIKKQESEGKFIAGSETFKENASNQFASVLDGVHHVQDELRKLFDEAVASKDIEAIKTYARLINENVETANKVLGDFKKEEKKEVFQESFGQMIERVKGSNAPTVIKLN